MIRFFPFLVAGFLIVLPSLVKADGDDTANDLARDEVAAIKKKLVTAQTALGAPPEGYTRTREDFDLPTSGNTSGGKMYPINSGVREEYGSKAKKEGEANQKKLEADFQQKYAEAMAKNDIEAIGKLSMEMQQGAAQNMAAMSTPKEPITVQIHFNSNPYDAIDPDAVVMEKPGVIALKKKNQSEESKGKVSLYFDPVILKDTKKLSKIELRSPEGGIAKKLAVFNIAINLEGPLEAAEAWAKKIDTKAILGLIDGASK
ncbi:MAG: hypothetical protein A2X86_08590 [Bdellovibrionales bacterium GWA2_49_15]|nr:MAG: hypothetical protein A2X86_08590 [Bdellovibrionales bacterium GWA2_49_15]HAZ11180.1 hypothetical protein [Bdellovibrionales bacterium]